MRVFLECKLSMGPLVCNTQTEHPKVALNLPYRQHLSLSVANWGAHIQFPVNPTFHCQSARTHHLLHQSGSFFLYINIIATKMGRNGAVLGQILHFGPFPLEKINKRDAKKVENQPSPYLLIKTQDDKVS